MQNQVIPNGSKVDTKYGVFEVLHYVLATEKYFCYKKGFDGHSGASSFFEEFINTKYEGSCWWFGINEVTLIEENEVSVAKQTKPNYREMKPTDLIKISIDGNESEVPIGDLVHTTALLGVSNGRYGLELWDVLTKTLGECCLSEDSDILIEFRENEKKAIDYFFQPQYTKQSQKEELSNLILSKQEELNQLIDTLNQM